MGVDALIEEEYASEEDNEEAVSKKYFGEVGIELGHENKI